MMVVPTPGTAMAIVVMMMIAIANAEVDAGSDAADMGSDANTGIRGHSA